MIRPNFFIVGAPKCGTSALWHYLGQHPQIVMPSTKEPHYFASDLPGYRTVDSLPAYLDLFQRSDRDAREVRAAGEASVYYLYSRTAIPSIRAFDPGAKLIAMVRNPIDMLHSFHGQLVFSHQEDKDFRTALSLQEARRRGKHIPHTSQEAAFLQYFQVAMLGEQIERMLSVFPAEQVKVLFFDDLGRATRETYEDVLRFLGVPSDGRTEFPVLNASKKRKSRLVGAATALFTYNVPEPVKASLEMVKQALGIKQVGLLKRVKRYNRVDAKREAVPADLRAEIAAALTDDVAKLGRILGRDLGHWLAPKRASAGAAEAQPA